jgi:F-type H+-transporting ATPase subunit alpha
LRDIPVERIKDFESEYIRVLNDKHSKVLSTIKQGKLTDEVVKTLEKVCAELAGKF